MICKAVGGVWPVAVNFKRLLKLWPHRSERFRIGVHQQAGSWESRVGRTLEEFYSAAEKKICG